MDNIKLLKQGLLIIAVAGLVACGGGSSSSSGPVYTGNTSPAKITAANADEILGATIDGAAPGGSASLSSDGSQSGQQKERLTGFASRLKKSSRKASATISSGNVNTTAAPVSADETIVGGCGGEMIVTGTRDDEVFDINIRAQFNNYCDEGATLNGTVTMVGKEYPNDSFDFTMTFQNISFKDDANSMSLNGSIAMAGTDASYSVNMTFDFSDNIAGKTYRVENYGAEIVEYGTYPDGYFTISIGGKVYHPNHGSFTIETLSLVHVNYMDEYPYHGSIKITGAENSSVTVTFNDDGTYLMEIDEDGVGGPEVTKSCAIATGVCEDAVL